MKKRGILHQKTAKIDFFQKKWHVFEKVTLFLHILSLNRHE